MTATTIQCRRFRNQTYALGLAANLMRGVAPFSGYQVEHFLGTLVGQIARRHYAFAIDGETAIGYAGWGLAAADVGAAWAEGRYDPTFQECVGGDSLLLFTIHGRKRAAVTALIRHMKDQYPGIRVFGRRDKGRGLRSVRTIYRGTAATAD